MELPAAIAKAFYIARTGRPGPVVVDITKDAQQEMAEYHYEKVSFIRSYCPSPAIDKEKIAEAAKLINLSRKPLALIGQGVILGGAETTCFPGKKRYPCSFHFIGTVGHSFRSSPIRRYVGYAWELCPQYKKQRMRFTDRDRHAF